MRNFVLKISTDYTEGGTLAQIMNPSSIEFAEELVGYEDFTCKIPIVHPDVAQITEHKKAAFYEIVDGSDVLIWSGYVDEPEHDFNWLYFSASDEKRFLREARIIIVDKDWSAGKTVTDALTELCNEANTRSGSDTGSLTFETDIGSEVINDTFSAGTDYLSILQKIAEKFEAQLTVRLNVIYLKTRIGTDRTSGVNFFELVASKGSPNENNISNLRYKRHGNQIVTYLYATNGTSNVSVTPTTPSEFPYIEKSQSVSGDDLTTDAQAYVDKYSLSQAEIEAELDQVLIDFYDLNVGDKIHIRIDQDNTFLDFEDDLEVIYKKSRVINGDLLFEAKVSTSTKQVVSGQAKLAGLETRIKTLELR